MLSYFWQATRGYRLRPWRSPYLRWRMETYWGTPADGIGFKEFCGFAWHQRREFIRFLRWSDRMRQRKST
jgi:hypothetical protein